MNYKTLSCSNGFSQRLSFTHCSLMCPGEQQVEGGESVLWNISGGKCVLEGICPRRKCVSEVNICSRICQRNMVSQKNLSRGDHMFEKI